jgi:hypothetical protein
MDINGTLCFLHNGTRHADMISITRTLHQIKFSYESLQMAAGCLLLRILPKQKQWCLLFIALGKDCSVGIAAGDLLGD